MTEDIMKEVFSQMKPFLVKVDFDGETVLRLRFDDEETALACQETLANSVSSYGNEHLNIYTINMGF